MKWRRILMGRNMNLEGMEGIWMKWNGMKFEWEGFGMNEGIRVKWLSKYRLRRNLTTNLLAFIDISFNLLFISFFFFVSFTFKMIFFLISPCSKIFAVNDVQVKTRIIKGLNFNAKWMQTWWWWWWWWWSME